MNRRFLSFVAAALAAALPAAAQHLAHVRIASDDAHGLEHRLMEAGFDVMHGFGLRWFVDVVVSPDERLALERMGLAPEPVALGRPFRDIQRERMAAGPEVPEGYPDLGEVLDEMRDAASAHPGIARFVDLTAAYGGPVTHDGRHIHAVRITGDIASPSDKPAFMLVSTHHSREIITPVIALLAIRELTEGYGVDPRITRVVDENDIWIVPVWNPDGYEHVFNVDNMWRKNRRDNGNGIFGVDLNRNYPFGWDASCSGSTSPSNQTYKGLAPASEPETQLMMLWSERMRFAKVLDFHSSGREVLYSYRCHDHPLSDYFLAEATALSAEHGYNGRTRPPSADGEQYQWQIAEFGSQAFLTETATSFQPPFVEAQAEAQRVWPGILWLLERPIPVSGRVSDKVTGLPVEASIWIEGVQFVNGEKLGSGGPHGRYHLFLPEGRYTLRFDAEGFVPMHRVVDVTAAGQVLDIELVPEVLRLSLLEGPAGLIAPGTTPPVRVRIEEGTQQLSPGSPTLHYRSGPGSFAAIPLSPAGGDEYVAALPPAVCGTDPEFYISARGDGGGTALLPPEAPAETFAFDVGELVTIFHDDFSGDKGWTVGAIDDDAIRGIWNRMMPEQTQTGAGIIQPGFTPTGTACFVTDGRAGSSAGSWDVDEGKTTVLSPVLDLAGADPTVSYHRWYSNHGGNNPHNDVFVVDASNDGGQTWENVETVGPRGSEARGTWFHVQHRVADVIAPTAQVQFRFIASDYDPQALVEALIDDFRIEQTVCDACYADCDADGTLTFFDFLCFQNAFLAQDPYADCDGDGRLTFFDFLCFQNEFLAGCP